MSPSIQEIKEKHAGRFLAMPGVVSVGIGRDPDGKPVIIVGLDGLHPQTQTKLPEILDSYPVHVEIIGPVKAL
jgi:hypothetical protein